MRSSARTRSAHESGGREWSWTAKRKGLGMGRHLTLGAGGFGARLGRGPEQLRVEDRARQRLTREPVRERRPVLVRALVIERLLARASLERRLRGHEEQPVPVRVERGKGVA